MLTLKDTANSKKAGIIYLDKGNFNTLVSEILCDTTEYEIAPTPETGVMNWYQCVGMWCLEWLMGDTKE